MIKKFLTTSILTLGFLSVQPSHALSTLVSGLGIPQGIAFDSNGDLFVANFGIGLGNGSIFRIPSGSSTASTFVSGLSVPRGLAFDSSNNLFVTGARSVLKIPSGSNTPTTLFTNSDNINGLAFDSSDNLFITTSDTGTNNSSILKLTAGGNTPSTFVALGNFSSNGLSNPVGLTFNSSGNLFVANASNTNNSSITEINSLGTIVTTITSPDLPRPFSIVFDSGGNLFVNNNLIGNTILKFQNTSGTLSLTPSTFIASGLNNPTFLAINNNTLYISDQGNGGQILVESLSQVPFEFSPQVGLGILGVMWLGRKLLSKVL